MDDEPDFSDLEPQNPTDAPNYNPINGTTKGLPNGGRKPRARKKDKQKTLETVFYMLKGGTPERDITHYLANEIGYTPKSARQLISVARAQLVAEIGRPKEVLRQEAYHRFMSVIDSEPKVLMKDGTPVIVPGAGPREKILANEGIIRLLGLAEPQRLNVDMDVGRKHDTETMDKLRELAVKDDVARELLIQLSERLNDFTPPNDYGKVATNEVVHKLMSPPNGVANGEEENTDSEKT